MRRLIPYSGILLALITGIFVVVFSNEAPASGPRALPPDATSTLSVVSNVTLPALILPDFITGASASSSVPAKAIPVVPPPPPPAPAHKTTAAPAASPAPVAPQEPTAPASGASLDAAAALLRGALVNILCYAPSGSALHSISGSGVVIDPKGYILTNAHVGQYFLLTDRGVSCTVRTGSPAHDSYRASLAYLPEAWVAANANVLTEQAPSGTGEHDYAILAIIGSATSAPLPAGFPDIPLAAAPPARDASVVLASYGAQFLAAGQVQSALFPTVVFGSVKNVYTFDTDTVDVLALGGSAAAQEGSSGGGVAGALGTLVGTITTSTVTGDTSSRSLNAITASYMRADYASATGLALDLLLAQTPSSAVADFAPHAPALEALLTENLPAQP